jgi:hypothetical protein
VALLLALPACALCVWRLWRYYGANPMAGGVEAPLRLLLEPPTPP